MIHVIIPFILAAVFYRAGMKHPDITAMLTGTALFFVVIGTMLLVLELSDIKRRNH